MTELTDLRGDITLSTELPQVKAGVLIQKQNMIAKLSIVASKQRHM